MVVTSVDVTEKEKMATKVGPVVRRNRPGTKAKASRLSLASYGIRRVL